MPIPYDSIGSIREFHLSVSHAALEAAHPVKDFAAAGLTYTRALWRFTFYSRWNRYIEALAEAIRECTITADVSAYDNFQENFAEAFAQIPERLSAARSEEDLAAVETSAIEMQEAIFVLGLFAGFESIMGILAGWQNTQDMFDAGLAGANGIVAGADNIDRFLNALSWANEHGYFGEAGARIVNAILENGVEILATMLGIITAGIAVQFVPGLNIAFDVALFLYGGFSLLEAIANIAQVVSEVFAATSILQLQRVQRAAGSCSAGRWRHVLRRHCSVLRVSQGIAVQGQRYQAYNRDR